MQVLPLVNTSFFPEKRGGSLVNFLVSRQGKTMSFLHFHSPVTSLGNSPLPPPLVSESGVYLLRAAGRPPLSSRASLSSPACSNTAARWCLRSPPMTDQRKLQEGRGVWGWWVFSARRRRDLPARQGPGTHSSPRHPSNTHTHTHTQTTHAATSPQK